MNEASNCWRDSKATDIAGLCSARSPLVWGETSCLTLAQTPHCVSRAFTSLPVNLPISCCKSALHARYCNFPLNLFSPDINSFIPPCIDSTHSSADTPHIFNLFVCSIVSALITSMFFSLSPTRAPSSSTLLSHHVVSPSRRVGSSRINTLTHCSALRVISYRQVRGFWGIIFLNFYIWQGREGRFTRKRNLTCVDPMSMEALLVDITILEFHSREEIRPMPIQWKLPDNITCLYC